MPTVEKFSYSAWKLLSRRTADRFEGSLGRTKETQESLLLRILRQNASTAYGSRFKFDSIGSIERYRALVPIVAYDDLRTYIAAASMGRKGVLTRERIRRFHLTSGTCGGNKLIPFTGQLQIEFRKALAAWIYNLIVHYPQITRGKAYWIVSPAAAPDKLPSASVPVGFDRDESYFGPIERFIAAPIMAVPPLSPSGTGRLPHAYGVLYHLLREREIRLISICYPIALFLILDQAEQHLESLLRDIYEGTFEGRKQVLNVRMPERAREIASLFGRRGGASSEEIWCGLWPKLALISAWGDAWAKDDAKALRKRFPGVPFQAKGLLATEAIVSIPYRPQGAAEESVPAPLLAICSHFFEFEEQESAKVFAAHELEKGGRYEVIVSTSGGLYRYRMGDIVSVSGFYRGTPCIRLLGRKRGISDLRGEKLEEDFVERAVSGALNLCRVSPDFWFIAPHLKGESRRYLLFLFLEENQNIEAIKSLRQAIDRKLCESIHYKNCRVLGQLEELDCFLLSPKEHLRYLEIKAGDGRLGVLKHGRLEQNPGWEKLLAGCFIDGDGNR